ncbi:helix-turn-helix domain-containing protein [Bacillus nitratireducens]|uniref:helix-turn-helix domain-containing protein n=1 Tax=Bacillus nitratireducens TaxID=2026193 RepID=UPI003879D436
MNDVLNYVYTSKEAAEIWGLSYQTVTQWYNRGKFENNEAKKSGGTILVTRQGMERLAGEINEEKRQKNILRRETTNNIKETATHLNKLQGFEQYNASTLIYECHRIQKLLREEDFTKLTLREVQTIHEDATALLNHVKEEVSKS